MTLQTLAWSLGQVAIHYNPVNGYYGVSSIGQLDTTQLSYPAMALVPSGDMTQRRGYSEYTLTFYVLDRLLTDSANDFDVYSYSVETLKNYFKQLRLLPGIIALTDEPTIRLFTTERGNDRVCGAYSTVEITVEDDAPCADWLDPLGNHTPDLDPDPHPSPEKKVPVYIRASLATGITVGQKYIIFEDRRNGGLVRNFPEISPFPSNYNSNLQMVYDCDIARDGNSMGISGSRLNYIALFDALRDENGFYFESPTFDGHNKVRLASSSKSEVYRIGVHFTGLQPENFTLTPEGRLVTVNEYFGNHLTMGSTFDEVLGKSTVLLGSGEETDYIMYLYHIDEIQYAEA